MSQGVRFCTAPDGVQLGYSVINAGRPLVIVPGWLMSPEADRRRLIGRDFWEDLPAGYRTITYDRRGIGVSTREVSDISPERQVDDLLALADHLRIPSFDLWGFGDGGAVCIAFTAQHPGRVTSLVLHNPWAWGEQIGSREAATAIADLIRADWGFGSRALAEILYPKGPLEAQESSTKAIRETQSPEIATRYMLSCFEVDVRDWLGKLALPVLVISCQGPGRRPVVPVEASRAVAAGIPGARFAEYEVSAPCPYFEYRMYQGLVREFLANGTREMPLHPTLSRREVEVLRLVAQGKTNGKIAEALVISPATAARHVHNILAKTGSANRAEAVLYAARHSLVG
ncbi:MAG: alpha/beta fold hydrolase [Tepidiformaceae bacterium]